MHKTAILIILLTAESQANKPALAVLRTGRSTSRPDGSDSCLLEKELHLSNVILHGFLLRPHHDCVLSSVENHKGEPAGVSGRLRGVARKVRLSV